MMMAFSRWRSDGVCFAVQLVHAYRLTCPGTVEERVLRQAERKLYLHTAVRRPMPLITASCQPIS